MRSNPSHPGKPSYLVNTVREKDVTVDWFFGAGHWRTKAVQGVLLLIGWFFTVLPVAITASSLLNRGNGSGWWGYREGFVMWDRTMAFLGILTGIFIVGFLVLHLVDRSSSRERDRRKTYDEQRLALRMEVADAWYADRYGPEGLRRQVMRVRVEPYSDIETYELRGLYRARGVD
jgi:hypothetical protein